MKIFKEVIKGQRIVLKRNKPKIKIAKKIFETINTNRKHLRPWLKWEKNTLKEEDSLKYLFDEEEKTKKREKVQYGIYLKNRYIGNIGIFDIDKINKSAEIGYWLSHEFTRNGYTTEALKLIEKELFYSLGLNRIQIKCDEKNIASSSVAKKCNYKLEGILRQNNYSYYFKNFRNTLIFSKLKSDTKK
jgi:ribosomal-protein-serine acetyltransferase